MCGFMDNHKPYTEEMLAWGVQYYKETGVASFTLCQKKFKISYEAALHLKKAIMSTKYKVLDLEQRSPEWIEERRKHIGASDAPVIMGESPWQTPFQLWQQKLGELKEQPENEYMKLGIAREDEARQAFIRKTGIEVIPIVVKSYEYPWMLSSLDGYNEHQKVIVEIKCPGPKAHEMAMDGVVPPYYLPQLFHQMLTLGVDKCFYFSYDPSSSKILEVQLESSYSKILIERERDFFKYMTELEAPPLIDRDYVQKNDFRWAMHAAEWLDTHAKLQFLKKKEEDLRAHLIGMCGQSNCMGAGIKMSKVIRKGIIDYKASPEVQKLDMEPYRKPPIETWRIGAC